MLADTCTVVKTFDGMIKHCRNDYNWIDDDTASYTPGWGEKLPKKNATQKNKADKKKRNPWLYRDSIELKAVPYMGTVNTYKGGGYVFNFFRDQTRTMMELADIRDQNWIDLRTRGLLVEFTVYNGNANLFGSVIMLIEFLANGGPVFTEEVKVFRVSSYVGGFGIIILLVQVRNNRFILFLL